VTYFFNGGVEQPFPGEERRLVPSNRNVATYDLAPEMSAVGVTDGVVDALKPGGPTFILVNYANPDMVGHTGKLQPAVSAIETIDASIRRIVEAARGAGATVFITADHGNCETMIDPETGEPHTAHTTNPVPLLMITPKPDGRTLQEGGRLADVAPTLLAYMGLPQPPEMEGRNLLAGQAPRDKR
jgi:2,3-bisphosphoglycerate-independent phosphoglycerate mutase